GGPAGASTGSVDDLSLDRILDRFEMRDVEAAHRLDDLRQQALGILRPSGRPQALLHVAQGAERLRAVESLALAVIAECHLGPRVGQTLLLIQSSKPGRLKRGEGYRRVVT